jgi:hypothetical protein
MNELKGVKLKYGRVGFILKQNGRKKMRKLIFILSFLLIFTSSASATIYKWVDEKGVVNFTDDYSNVRPDYRNKVEEVNIAKMGPSTPSNAPPGKTVVSGQPGGVEVQAPPPIAQTLIREGDLAVKLAEALKIGQAKTEPEAEDMLTSVGIAPKNGWIADYPVTPDVIGELQSAIGGAVDSGKLAMDKEQAIKALQDLTAQQGLPVRADTEGRHTGAEPPVEPPPGGYGEYSRPEVINNYYYDQGPPIVTYYPPPWDYYYLYAWVPYPFWYSGFRFPGFFCLHDFHRVAFINRKAVIFSNHVIDAKTRGVVSIDPAKRGIRNLSHTGVNVSSTREFTSPEARRGAASIFDRSQGRTRPRNSTSSGTRGVAGRQVFTNRSSNLSSFGGRGGTGRPAATNYGMGRSQAGVGSRNREGSSFHREGSFGNSSRIGSGSPMGGRSFGGFHGGVFGTGSRGFSGGGSRR